MQYMRVALVYDRVNKWGGAERVLLALHAIFPEAPLYTSVCNLRKAPWASVFTIHTSFLQKFPFASTFHELYAFLMPVAFESFTFDQYDIVISVTSESAKGIITKPGTFHLCYCLTPTRYLWSGFAIYFQNQILRFFAQPIIQYLKQWDIFAAQRPDMMIAISEEVKKRILHYYDRDVAVIYPPITLDTNKNSKREVIDKNYFLIISRLVPYKRIDLAIKACNQLKLPLKIIGTGHEERNLQKIAGKHIEFLGTLTDQEIINYYRNCIAFIFTGEEDFGLTVLEAQKFGKPVIAFAAGGALETIIPGKTGEFFFPQTIKALRETLEKFDKFSYNSKDCMNQAKKFDLRTFQKKFSSIIKNYSL